MFSLKTHTIHIRLYTDRVVLRYVDRDVTLDKKSIEKFSNSRMVLANFRNAESHIRFMLDEISEGKKFRSPIRVLIQPMEKVEDGISQVEEVSFNDLALQIGAKYAFIHRTQEVLDDQRIRELTK
jgi:rod shape-determining protein MreB